jgi:triacylglycerol lipase
VVSYIEALRHVPPRSPKDTAVSVLKECWHVAWTQPLLPLFQLTARKMSTGGGSVPIVLVHGYCQNRVDFLYLAQRLRRAGCGPLYACNFFWPQPLERSAATVQEFVEWVRAETGAAQVDLLTHSSGGLLALELLGTHPEWVRRVCVIAIPWRGVTWRGPVVGPAGSQLRADSRYAQTRPQEIVGGPVLSIYSAHDNLVHPPETSQLTGADVETLEVRNLGHLSVLFDRSIANAACEFLLHSESPARNSDRSAGAVS